MTADYKPVPDDLLAVLEHLIDAAENVTGWAELRDFDVTEDDLRRSIDRLGDAVVKASAYLERTA